MLKQKKLIVCFRFFVVLILLLRSIIPLNIKALENSLQKKIPQEKKTLHAAWFTFEPYSMIVKDEGFQTLTGLDIELLRIISERAGYHIETKNVDWDSQIQGLKKGAQDIATSAIYTEERAKFFYFSEPYRKEENSFYVKKGNAANYFFDKKDMTSFINILKEKKLRIAVMNGAVMAAPAINQYLADPKYQDKIIRTKDCYESIANLLNGNVDGFFDDRIVASTSIWRLKVTHQIEEVHLGISTPIHLIFSKKSVPYSVVKKFNQAIKDLKGNGEYSQTLKNYLFPVMLLQTVERPWFFILELLGVSAAVAAGLILARKDGLNLYGTAVLAFTAMSGGIMRDILVNRPKLGIMTTPFYASLILLTVLVAYITRKFIVYFYADKLKNLSAEIKKKWDTFSNLAIDFFDALSLGAFTITGVIIAVVSKLEPLWFWGAFLAVVSTTGGTVAREILRGNREIRIMKTEFYAPIAFVWGGLFSYIIYLETEVMSPEKMFNWILVVLVGSFFTRLFFIYYEYRKIFLPHVFQNERSI